MSELMDRKKITPPRLHKSAITREIMLKIYSEIIDLTRYYINLEDIEVGERRRWVSSLNSILATACNLVRDTDLDELKKRVAAIEKQRKGEWSAKLIKSRTGGVEPE